MKLYVGYRLPARHRGACRVVVYPDATATVRVPDAASPLPPRNDLRNHSPDGYEWGYSGSGPAQLALALAADCLGSDVRALLVYQRLKFRLVAGLPADGWRLTEEDLRRRIEAIEAEERSKP